MGLIQDGNLCVANVVEKYDIKDELREFMSIIFSDMWIETVEFGNAQDFKQELAVAIDPLTTKLLMISGQDFAENMSFELGQWIKDSTLLWIKNRGAGSPTTEAEVKRIEEM